MKLNELTWQEASAKIADDALVLSRSDLSNSTAGTYL